jgi:peptide deformylase
MPGVDEDPFGHDEETVEVEHADGHSGELAG